MMQEQIKKDDDYTLMGEFDLKAPIEASFFYLDSDNDDECDQQAMVKERSKNDQINQYDIKNNSQKGLDMPSIEEHIIDTSKLNNVIADIIKNCKMINEKTKGKNIKRPMKRKLSLKNKKNKPVTDFNDEKRVKKECNEENIISPPSNESEENIECANKNVDKINNVNDDKCTITTNVQPTIQENQYTINLDNSKTSNNENDEKQGIALGKESILRTKLDLNYEKTRTTTVADKSPENVPNTSIERQETTTNNEPINLNNSSVQFESSLDTNVDLKDTQNSNIMTYLQNILNTVSEHLIILLKTHSHYKQRIKEDMRQQTYYYEKFLKYKYYLFNLSYSAVVNLLLPKEKSDGFIKAFIQNTILLANAKSLQCSEEQIRPLYIDLIHWVKHVKQRLNGILEEEQNPITSQKESPQRTHQVVPERQQCPFVTIGTRITDKSYTPKELDSDFRTCKTGHIAKNTHSQNLTAIRPCPSYSTAISKSNNIYSLSSSIREPSYQTIHENIHNVHQGNVYNNSNMTQTNMYNNINLTQANSLRPSLQRDTFQTQHANEYPVNPVGHINNRYVEKSLPNIGTFLYPVTPAGRLDLHHNQGHNLHIPLSQSNNSRANENVLSINHYVNQNQGSAQVPDEACRSSVSRDSGFHSPNVDKRDSRLQQEPFQLTPLITHVTSLNPNIVNNTEGPCYICGKLTKQKCISCYSKYYCSYTCQNYDWNNHMVACSKIQENYGINH